ncbi:MAG TPA: lipocalin family protein [Burkholderiaceae bacterium]|nr:lipocalin family protein [Burkholderiaceae bacterium]
MLDKTGQSIPTSSRRDMSWGQLRPNLARHTGSSAAGRVDVRALCSLILAFVLSAAVAQTQISPMALVGRWSASATNSSGVTIATDVVFTQNMHFFASSTVDGKTFLDFGGTWSVSGNTLAWRYLSSSGSAPAPGTTDTDEIVSVAASKLVLRSSLSGKQHEYIRMR